MVISFFHNLIKNLLTFYLAYIAIKIILFIYKNFLRKRINFIKRYGENSWVMVTGATDGLGKVFCEDFAKLGFNIILVSRTLEKLEKVAKEIETKYSVKTHYIQFDFTTTDVEEYKTAFQEIPNKFDVSILVNNIGLLSKDYHMNLSVEECYKMAITNTMPQTILTKIFSKPLSQRKMRSAIIDMSSLSSICPFRKYSVYGATKKFNLYLTRALAEEYQNLNIDFLAVKPSLIATPMTGLKSNFYYVLTPEQVVNGTLNDLGYEKETNGHWIHKVLWNILSYFPLEVLYLLGY
jgi:17beta-estradiol 17-dehydrogenase / very-long-chain 3-oxoacyl-CoA reductase